MMMWIDFQNVGCNPVVPIYVIKFVGAVTLDGRSYGEHIHIGTVVSFKSFV